jgi:dipeptidyl aminopeptidase/acylaminoacyl peptidase
MGLGPEDLAKVVLVSSPEVNGGRVLFTVTKVSLEQNRYESSVWVYEGVPRGPPCRGLSTSRLRRLV